MSDYGEFADLVPQAKRTPKPDPNDFGEFADIVKSRPAQRSLTPAQINAAIQGHSGPAPAADPQMIGALATLGNAAPQVAPRASKGMNTPITRAPRISNEESRLNALAFRKKAEMDGTEGDSESAVPHYTHAQRADINTRWDKWSTKEALAGRVPESLQTEEFKANRAKNQEHSAEATMQRVGDAVNQTIGVAASHNTPAALIPGAKHVVEHTVGSLAGGVNPLSMAGFADQVTKDPAGVATETGLSINKIWGWTEDGKPVSINDRIDGVISLVGTAMAVTDFAGKVKGGSLVKPEVTAGIKKFLSKGVKPEVLAAKLGPEGAAIVKEATVERAVQAPPEQPPTVDTPPVHVEPPVETQAAEPTKPVEGFGNHEQTANLRKKWELPERAKDGTTIAEARDKAVNSGEYANADKIAADLLNKPRPLSASEHIALMMRGDDLEAQLKASSQALDAAIASGDETAAAAHKAAYTDLFDKAHTIIKASEKSGSEWGVAGRTRQILKVLPDPSSAVQMQAEFERQVGKATPKQAAKIAELAKAHADLTDQLTAAEAKAAAQDAEIARLTAEKGTKARPRRSGRAPDAIHAEIQDLLKQYSENRKEGMRLGAGLPVDVWVKQAPVVAKLAKNYIELGVVHLPELVAKIQSHFPELSKKQVYEAIGDSYPREGARTPTEAAVQIRNMKSLARMSARVEEALSGEYTPGKKPVSTPEVAQLRRELNQIRKGNGSDVEVRLQQSLDKAIKQLETGQRNPQAVKPVDTEAAAATRKQLKDVRQQIGLTDRISALEEQLRTKDFPEKPPKSPASYEVETLRKRLDRLRHEADVYRESQKRLSFTDMVAKVQHFSIFSGTNVFAKLGGATVSHIPIEAVADILEKPLGKLLSDKGTKLGDIAGRSGSSASAELKGVMEFVNKSTYKDAWMKATKGFNSLDAKFGAPHANKPFWDFWGNLHGAVKTPLQRSVFAKSMELRLKMAEARGLDITHPAVNTAIAESAYNDSLEAILRNDSKLASGVSAAFRPLGAVGKVLVPVTKVGANYVGRAVQYTGAGILEGLGRQLGAKLRTGEITAAQAETILKAYKRGGVGFGVAALVYINPGNVIEAGGYYSPGTKAPKDRKFGDLKIAGIEVPHQLGHNPIFEAIQFHQTIKNGFGTNDKEAFTDRAGKAVFQAGYGVLEQTPGLEVAADSARALRSPDAAGQVFGNYLKSVIEPSLIQQIAKGTDKDAKGETVQRRQKGAMDVLKGGIPGVRQTLPKK